MKTEFPITVFIIPSGQVRHLFTEKCADAVADEKNEPIAGAIVSALNIANIV